MYENYQNQNIVCCEMIEKFLNMSEKSNSAKYQNHKNEYFNFGGRIIF